MVYCYGENGRNLFRGEPCLYKGLGKFYYNVAKASKEVETSENLLNNLSSVPKLKAFKSLRLLVYWNIEALIFSSADVYIALYFNPCWGLVLDNHDNFGAFPWLFLFLEPQDNKRQLFMPLCCK